MPKVPIRKFQNFTGITDNTTKHIQMDAGVVFKNFAVGTDTYETAKNTNKVIGATRGGSEFSAVPTVRHIEVDGKRGNLKGDLVIDDWAITLKATFVETTVETVQAALGVSSVDTEAVAGYRKITGEYYVVDDDYIDNITWVGRIKGAETPAIIQIENALCEAGLTYAVTDKGNGVVEVTFTANGKNTDFDNTASAPFSIYIPEVAE